MPTIEEIVSGAVEDAQDGVADADPGIPAGTEATPAAGTTAETPPLEVPSKSADPAKPDLPAADPAKPLSEVEQALESAGIKPPIEGQRENRIPYSRVQKIVENFEKKLNATHEAAIKEATTKFTTVEPELQNFRKVDQLITTDPDKYIGMLATLYPDKYKRFVTPAGDTKPVVAAAPNPLGARPAPDVTFTDGSTGYSPEQHDKLLDWVAQTAEANAIKRFDERFAPLEKDRKTAEARQQAEEQRARDLPAINARLANMSAIYGKLFDDDFAKQENSETLKLIRSKGISMEAACAEVFTPLLRADENTLRAKILKEMNERPRAADKTAPAAVGDRHASDGPATIEDVIREAIKPLRK